MSADTRRKINTIRQQLRNSPSVFRVTGKSTADLEQELSAVRKALEGLLDALLAELAEEKEPSA